MGLISMGPGGARSPGGPWLPRRRALAQLAAACVALTPLDVAPQVVEGTVTEAGTRQPVPGVLVSIQREGTPPEVGRAMTGPDGRFVIRLARAGSYVATAKRIGVRPVRTERFAVGDGARVTVTLEVERVATPLSAVEVSARNACGPRARSDPSAGRMLEELLASIALVSLSSSGPPVQGTVTRYVQWLDPRTSVVLDDSTQRARGRYQTPFVSRPADSLRLAGFVVEEANGDVVFLAPDPHVLASASFIDSHCFSVARDTLEGTRLGLAVRPLPRQRRPDVEGVIWFDRATAELREFRFKYVNIDSRLADPKIGGAVAFRRLESGRWIVSEWHITAPLVQVFRGRDALVGKMTVRGENSDSVLALRREGGFVEIEGTRPGHLGAIEGTVSDHAGARGSSVILLSGTRRYQSADSLGRFSFSHVLPGRYVVVTSRSSSRATGGAMVRREVVVPPGDTVRLTVDIGSSSAALVRLCGERSVRDATGGVWAVLLDSTTMEAARDVRLTLVTNRRDRVSLSGLRLSAQRIPVRTDRDGIITSCHHEADEQVTLRLGSAPGSPLRDLGRVAPSALLVAHLPVDRAGIRDSRPPASARSRGVLVGVVEVLQAGSLPSSVPNDVLLLSTQERRELAPCGVFQFANVPPGEHVVRVRTAAGGFNLTLDVVASDTTAVRLRLPSGGPPQIELVRPAAILAARATCGQR